MNHLKRVHMGSETEAANVGPACVYKRCFACMLWLLSWCIPKTLTVAMDVSLTLFFLLSYIEQPLYEGLSCFVPFDCCLLKACSFLKGNTEGVDLEDSKYVGGGSWEEDGRM